MTKLREKFRSARHTLTLALIVALGSMTASCGGGSSSPPDRPDPVTDLAWDQGNWDALDWQ